MTRGLPVVAVEDVRRPSRVAEQRQRGAAERAEAFQVVRVVAAALAIQSGAVEQSIVGDEVHGHRAAGQPAFEEPHRDTGVAERDLRLADRAEPELLAIDRTIRRHDDAHIASELRQGARERPGHVGQPTGLGVRNDFRGAKTDA